MKAKHKKFSFDHTEKYYVDEACDFMSKIGQDKVIGITQHRSSTECSVTVWYWFKE